MPRFDIYRNPDPRASHALYLDVQSDLVSTATRWCIPLFAAMPGQVLISRAQGRLTVQGAAYVMDAPNILAVPAALLRAPVERVRSDDQPMVEGVLDFMLRGY